MEQREIDNMLLSMIQKHFPSLPLSDEYTDWGKWLGFARAVYESGRASPASVPEVTDGMAYAFHHALTDHSIGQEDLDEIKTGLRAALAAAPTPPENKALLEAVAEVVWYDPQISQFPEKPGKIIDGSIAFMESAEIGTKLFAAPVPSVSEDRKDAERYLWLRASDFDIFGSPHAIHLSGKELDQAIDAAMQEDKP